MEKVNTRMIGIIPQLDRSSWICMKCYADGIKEHAKHEYRKEAKIGADRKGGRRVNMVDT